jgi:hypothetical protein
MKLKLELIGIGDAMGLSGQVVTVGYWGLEYFGVVLVTTQGGCTKPQIMIPSFAVL